MKWPNLEQELTLSSLLVSCLFLLILVCRHLCRCIYSWCHLRCCHLPFPCLYVVLTDICEIVRNTYVVKLMKGIVLQLFKRYAFSMSFLRDTCVLVVHFLWFKLCHKHFTHTHNAHTFLKRFRSDVANLTPSLSKAVCSSLVLIERLKERTKTSYHASQGFRRANKLLTSVFAELKLNVCKSMYYWISL